jgi:hypothetical protein
MFGSTSDITSCDVYVICVFCEGRRLKPSHKHALNIGGGNLQDLAMASRHLVTNLYSFHPQSRARHLDNIKRWTLPEELTATRQETRTNPARCLRYLVTDNANPDLAVDLPPEGRRSY